jgi:hypothetical protein
MLKKWVQNIVKWYKHRKKVRAMRKRLGNDEDPFTY